MNDLLELKPEADGSVDLSKLGTARVLYLAPSAYDRFTFNRSVIQGSNTKTNPASISLELTYTLVK